MEAASNNVIVFPKENKNITKPSITIEEIEKNVEQMHLYHIQETIANIAPTIFNQLDISGFEVGNPDDIQSVKDGAFIVEALRSIMCKHYKIYHPFQRIVDAVFLPDETDPTALKVADELSVTLKDEKEAK